MAYSLLLTPYFLLHFLFGSGSSGSGASPLLPCPRRIGISKIDGQLV